MRLGRRAWPHWLARFATPIRGCGVTPLWRWTSSEAVGGTSPTAARSSTSVRRCPRSWRRSRIRIRASGHGLRRTSATWVRPRQRPFHACAPCCIVRMRSRAAAPAEPSAISDPRRAPRCRTCAALSRTRVRRFGEPRSMRSRESTARMPGASLRRLAKSAAGAETFCAARASNAHGPQASHFSDTVCGRGRFPLRRGRAAAFAHSGPR